MSLPRDGRPAFEGPSSPPGWTMTLTLSVRADEDGGLEDDEAARDRPGERGKGRRTPPLEVAEAVAVALRYLPPAVLESARAGMEAIRPLPLSEVDLPSSRVMCDVVMCNVVMANIVRPRISANAYHYLPTTTRVCILSIHTTVLE